MGADMAAAVIVMPKGVNLETECKELIARTKSLTFEEVAEIYSSIYCGLDDEEEKDIRDNLADKKAEIEKMIQTGYYAMNSRQCTCIIHGNNEIYVSGGLSHDGVPSSAYTDMTNLWYIIDVLNRKGVVCSGCGEKITPGDYCWEVMTRSGYVMDGGEEFDDYFEPYEGETTRYLCESCTKKFEAMSDQKKGLLKVLE